MKINKKILMLVISISMISTASLGTIFASTLSDINKEKSQVKEKRDEANSKFQSQIEELKGLQEKVDKAKSKVGKSEKEIKVIKGEIKEKKEKMQSREEGLNTRIRTMYKNGTAGFLDVILQSKDMSEFLSNIILLQKIYLSDQSTLEELKKEHKELKDKEKSLEIAKANLEENVKTLSKDQEAADKRRKELKSVIDKLDEQYNQLQADSEAIAAKIRAAEEAARRKVEEQKKREEAKQNENNSGNDSGGSSSETSETIDSGNQGRGFGYPVSGHITSPFGYRIHPIFGTARLHTGIDFGVGYGTPVRAASSGTVIMAGSNGGYGNCVVISHGGSISTLYAHNSSLAVHVGQRVSRGQVVAYAGSTGWSTGVHCHFEVRVNGRPVNPMNYIG